MLWLEVYTKLTILSDFAGSRLRHLFAIILFYCRPISPDALWANFHAQICDDLRHRLRLLGYAHPTDDDIYDYGLFLLDKCLRQLGSRLHDFDAMPQPRRDWEREAENPFVAEQLDYDVQAERERAAQRIPCLNAEQRLAFEKIVQSTLDNEGKTFFLNGPGGTGKTFVYNTICSTVRALVQLEFHRTHCNGSLGARPWSDRSMCCFVRDSITPTSRRAHGSLSLQDPSRAPQQ